MTKPMRHDRQERAPVTGNCRARRMRLVVAGVVVAASSVAARLAYARRTSQQVRSRAESTITTDDGVQLHVETDGLLESPLTVVFVHGFNSRLQEFQAQRAALRDRARLVLFDHRGHGCSGWGRFRKATINQLAHDLALVIEQQPPSRIVLVAHSMGGMAALTLAGERAELFGERIVAVTLISTAAGSLPATTMPRTAARLATRLRLATAAAWLLWLISPAIDQIAPFRRPKGRQWLLHRLFSRDEPPKEAAQIMQDSWMRTPLAIATAFYPALVSYNAPAALSVLQRIPVLIVSGTQDRAIPPHRSEHLAHEIGASSHLVMVKGAGHMVNLTHPDEVNTALIHLLENLDTARPTPHLPNSTWRPLPN